MIDSTSDKLLTELEQSKIKLDKFAKFNPAKHYQISIRQAQKVLNAYCSIKFNDHKYDQHPLRPVYSG